MRRRSFTNLTSDLNIFLMLRKQHRRNVAMQEHINKRIECTHHAIITHPDVQDRSKTYLRIIGLTDWKDNIIQPTKGDQ